MEEVLGDRVGKVGVVRVCRDCRGVKVKGQFFGKLMLVVFMYYLFNFGLFVYFILVFI